MKCSYFSSRAHTKKNYLNRRLSFPTRVRFDIVVLNFAGSPQGVRWTGPPDVLPLPPPCG